MKAGTRLNAGGRVLPQSPIVVEQVKGVLNQLDPREAAILRMRFGLDGEMPMSYKAIGKRTGLTKERVSRIVNDVLKSLLKAN